MRKPISLLLLLIACGCSETAKLPVAAVTGPTPTLVEPRPQLIPTFQIAPAKGWPAGTTPVAWQPQSGELWAAVNERDEIGSDLVPDYMTSVKDGAFYG